MSKKVIVGDRAIGGGESISIQSMLNVPLSNIPAAAEQIRRLELAGCEIIRAAVPDEDSAKALSCILKSTNVPMVADIHFDYRLAIAAVEAGVAKVRINPGNIGGKEKVREVCRALIDHGTAVRIGVNSGSVEADLLEKYHGPTPQALVESAQRSIGYFNEFGYDNIVVSIKSSDVPTTYQANKLFSKNFDYPLHLGITEAGSETAGIVRSSVGIGALLLEGIGDTIRVSLTGDPVLEVEAAKEILYSCNLRKEGLRVVSCPTCGRTKTNIVPIVSALKKMCKNIKTPVSVAVMGCVVNGPGEAKEADLGVACGKGMGLIFKSGKALYKVKEDEILPALIKEITDFTSEVPNEA